MHLLPSFDIASIEEDRAAQAVHDCDLASMGPGSEEQQACVDAVRAKDAFNWGYDPWHWMAPEGSYTSTPEAADGGARIAEFRTMVGALHRDGLVTRTAYAEVPPRVEYELTALGRSLAQAVDHLVLWVRTHQSAIAGNRDAFDGG